MRLHGGMEAGASTTVLTVGPTAMSSPVERALPELDPTLDVRAADTVRGALDAFADAEGEGRAALVVVDLELENAAAFQLIEFLRDDPAVPPVPIIAVHAPGALGDAELGYEAGANVCIPRLEDEEAFGSLLADVLSVWLTNGASPLPPR